MAKIGLMQPAAVAATLVAEHLPMLQHIAEQGHELCGKHHEIYLSDIRRADHARWRTVVRQPFK